jgi:acetolactate synthase-1/2/3 large subunit
MWAAQYYTFDRPNAHITSGGLGTMGFSVPAAVGVQFARPNEEVWCMVGDGCFQMTNQELAVMVQERLPVKIALFNNQSLGMVRQWQDLFYDGRLAETEFVHSPDFVKLADAYGIPGSRVTSPREIERAVNEAREFPGPYLIEFGTSRTENCFPMVVPGTALIEVIPDETYTGGNHRGPAVHAQPGGQLVSATRVRN